MSLAQSWLHTRLWPLFASSMTNIVFVSQSYRQIVASIKYSSLAKQKYFKNIIFENNTYFMSKHGYWVINKCLTLHSICLYRDQHMLSLLIRRVLNKLIFFNGVQAIAWPASYEIAYKSDQRFRRKSITDKSYIRTKVSDICNLINALI